METVPKSDGKMIDRLVFQKSCCNLITFPK